MRIEGWAKSARHYAMLRRMGSRRSSRSFLLEAAAILAPLHRRWSHDGALEPERFEEVADELVLVLVPGTRREEERASRYRAPEQRLGDPNIGPAADVFALGAIVSARLERDGESADERLRDVLERMGAIDVASRLADADDVALALEGGSPRGQVTPHPTPEEPTAPGASSATRNPTSDPRTHEVGDVVADHFELLARLGRGGMGEVWEVRNTLTSTSWALKIMDADRLAPVHRRRFFTEARAACLVAHPSVIQVVDVVDVGGPEGRAGVPGILMERLHGRTLRAHLEREGRIDVAEVVRLMLPVVDAIRSAHARGVVHRDLKPENLFLVGDGASSSLKILDFGIAKLLHSTNLADRTITGQVIGTPDYMAPEQWLGDEVGPAADVWALGVILFELLSGTKPFVGKSPAHVRRAILQPSLSAVPDLRSTPHVLRELISRMLARDAGKRPSLELVHATLSRPMKERAWAPTRALGLAAVAAIAVGALLTVGADVETTAAEEVGSELEAVPIALPSARDADGPDAVPAGPDAETLPRAPSVATELPPRSAASSAVLEIRSAVATAPTALPSVAPLRSSRPVSPSVSSTPRSVGIIEEPP